MWSVAALLRKPAPGRAMEPVPTLTGRAHHGLVDDAGADPRSLRHVLLVSTADLAAARVTAADLRANLVIDGDLHALTSGSVVRFGTLALRITIPCESCARLDRVRPHLSRELGPRRGLLARVLTHGHATLGDPGHLLPITLPPIHTHWHARVRALVTALPPDHFLDYPTLARAVGVQSVYCRAMPAVLRSLDLPAPLLARIVPTHQLAHRPLWDVAAHHAAPETILALTPSAAL